MNLWFSKKIRRTLLLIAVSSLALVLYFDFVSIRNRFFNVPNKALLEVEQHHSDILNTYMERSLLFLNEYLHTLPLPSRNTSETRAEYMYRLLEFERLAVILTSDLDSAFSSDSTFCVFIEDFPYASTMHISSMDLLDPQLTKQINEKKFAQIHFAPGLLETDKNDTFLVFYRNFNRSLPSRNVILRTMVPYKAIENKAMEINKDNADFTVIHVVGDEMPEKAKGQIRTIQGVPMSDGSSYIVEISRAGIAAAALTPIGIWAAFAMTLFIMILYMQKQVLDDLEQGLSQFINSIDSPGELPFQSMPFESQGNRFTRRIYTMLQSQLIRRQESEMLRMQLIQERMNPHLLYNVLASLKVSIMKYGDETLTDLIGAIGNFFRASLKKERNFPP